MISANNAISVVQQFLLEYNSAQTDQQVAQAAFSKVNEDLSAANARLGALTSIKNSLFLLPEIQRAAKSLGVDI